MSNNTTNSMANQYAQNIAKDTASSLPFMGTTQPIANFSQGVSKHVNLPAALKDAHELYDKMKNLMIGSLKNLTNQAGDLSDLDIAAIMKQIVDGFYQLIEDPEMKEKLAEISQALTEVMLNTITITKPAIKKILNEFIDLLNESFPKIKKGFMAMGKDVLDPFFAVFFELYDMTRTGLAGIDAAEKVAVTGVEAAALVADETKNVMQQVGGAKQKSAKLVRENLIRTYKIMSSRKEFEKTNRASPTKTRRKNGRKSTATRIKRNKR
jgi:inhibitor of KinA sporulation pathway (predicted exonuclease)